MDPADLMNIAAMLEKYDVLGLAPALPAHVGCEKANCIVQ
jgi:hypothetical protein